MNIASSHYLILILVISTINSSFAISVRALEKEDRERASEQMRECEEIKEYGTQGDFPVDCFKHYQHFGGDVHFKMKSSRDVKISSFNIFHPGSDSSLFKDNELVAMLMNRFDVVAAQELLPLVGRQQSHNDRLVKYIDGLQLKLDNLLALMSSARSTRNIAVINLEKKIEQASELYRLPGYLVLLKQLRRLDKSWSLVLAPGADAEKKKSVKELVGFYYRSSQVRLIDNEHCSKFSSSRGQESVACFPDFSKKWLGQNIRSVFSRRPFMASFQSGSFDFTLITSHVVFGAPTSKKDIRDILRPSFGVDHYDELGKGVNKQSYARFAEVKMTLEVAQKIKTESKEKDIIFLGDLNLETTNDFWPDVLASFPGSQIYVDEKTTLSAPYQLSSGLHTGGLASSFDHVIMDPSETSECSEDIKADDFVNGDFSSVIDQRYLIRSKAGTGQSSGGQLLRRNMEQAYLGHLESLVTVRRNKLAPAMSVKDIEDRTNQFSRRIFAEQLERGTYYKMYREVISDHLPVYFFCSTR
jgi:endonuclease/exonuclease/phosphatase family metal-dependent hydrolase